MCGITGIFNIDGAPVSISLLRKMTDKIAHRGPDGEGFYTDSFIGFGHRRLAIIDLSPLGHQPMQSEDGNYIITYNGEVYNFQNIRMELEAKGYSFRSKTDSEVILKSFIEWGKECVHKFNGMFAFAIWDKNKHELFIARDRYGIKPLYYFFNGTNFIFGSEIKSILANPIYKPAVCTKALNEYFSFQNILSDLTLFKDIKLLPAASTISLRLSASNSFEVKKYWDYNFVEEHVRDGREHLEEVTRLFEQAVNRQLISDVEVGSYLSGGMDSGAVTCVAASQFKNLKTFTCGFDLSSASGLELGFDERSKAEFLSNVYKTEHYEVVLKAGDMERVMKELIYHLEDPRVGQSYPNYYVARLASKFVKVVLSGAGGDELFAGYPWRYYKAAMSEDSNEYIDHYYSYWQRLIPDSRKSSFYQPNIYPDILAYPTKDVFKSVLNGKSEKSLSSVDYINNSLYFEIKTFLHGLLVVEDKLSMAHSLESRVPFLDNDLVDYAMKIPVSYKLKNLQERVRINENEPGPKENKYFEQTSDGKLILRQALAKYVPDNYSQGKKQGFSAPDASWFKGESIDYIKDLLYTHKASAYDYIQYDTAKELMAEHFDGKVNRRLFIWSLLCFEWWLKNFME
ncbi:asparagine synthase (glutamine-hydrolyzing) [soil metagenome]